MSAKVINNYVDSLDVKQLRNQLGYCLDMLLTSEDIRFNEGGNAYLVSCGEELLELPIDD